MKITYMSENARNERQMMLEERDAALEDAGFGLDNAMEALSSCEGYEDDVAALEDIASSLKRDREWLASQLYAMELPETGYRE